MFCFFFWCIIGLIFFVILFYCVIILYMCFVFVFYYIFFWYFFIFFFCVECKLIKHIWYWIWFFDIFFIFFFWFIFVKVVLLNILFLCEDHELNEKKILTKWINEIVNGTYEFRYGFVCFVLFVLAMLFCFYIDIHMFSRTCLVW